MMRQRPGGTNTQLDLFVPPNLDDPSVLVDTRLHEPQIGVRVPYGGNLLEGMEALTAHTQTYGNGFALWLPGTYGFKEYGKLCSRARAPIAQWMSNLYRTNNWTNDDVVGRNLRNSRSRPQGAGSVLEAYEEVLRLLHIVQERPGLIREQTAYAYPVEIAKVRNAWFTQRGLYSRDKAAVRSLRKTAAKRAPVRTP